MYATLLGLAAVTAVALTPTNLLAQRGSSDRPIESEAEQTMRQQVEMQGQMHDLPERERLEQMRSHMVEGMRRMAVRMDAIEKRIAAIDRGEPGGAPMPGMGMGMGMGQGQGQGMRARDGSGAGAGCPNMPSVRPKDSADEGADS
jgi:hypothetical protein